MISRREFLKLAGLSAIGFTAGNQLSKFFNNRKANSIYLTALLPKDDHYINFVLNRFLDKVEQLESDSKVIKQLRQVNFSKTLSINYEKNTLVGDNIYNVHIGDCRILFSKIDANYNSDIFFKDDNHSIYMPDELSDLFFIRDEIRNQKAEVKLICEYGKENIFDKLFVENKQYAIVEVDNYIVDKIPLDKNYKQIPIKGKNGILNLSVDNQLIRVTDSSCRNKLCVHSEPIGKVNQNIICAPNRVLIKINYV